MTDVLVDCQWPPLSPTHLAALREAVAFTLARFDVHGVIAAGAIVRGDAHAASDLDLYVVHHPPFRQRLQRFFGGVPVEIFVNPPSVIRAYFAEEHEDGRPRTAHMLATGTVVVARTPEVQRLCAEAEAWLARRSPLRGEPLTAVRYAAAGVLEDAHDVADTDPATAAMLLGRAVIAMLQVYCRATTGVLPRDKDLLSHVGAQDWALGAMAAVAFSDAPLIERFRVADEIADRTIGARGFFEWESTPQPFDGVGP